jgi:hypothetical protein
MLFMNARRPRRPIEVVVTLVQFAQVLDATKREADLTQDGRKPFTLRCERAGYGRNGLAIHPPTARGGVPGP